MSIRTFKVGDEITAVWDVPMPKNIDFCGKIIAANKLSITIAFNEANAGLKKLEKFTLRKDGEYRPANWHWVCGVPIAVNKELT